MIRVFVFFVFIFFPFIKGQSIRVLDKNTNEYSDYHRVDVWHDGTKMEDSKVDGVIYIRENESYYRRVFYGKVNVKWFGAKGDNKTNDTQAFVKALDFLKKSITPSQLRPYILFVPRGDYIVDKIVWDYDGFQMEGEGPLHTVFKFTNKMRGVEAGIYPLNNELNTEKKGFKFYTNVSIKNIGCDPVTIGIGKSFILIRNTYNFTLRNINILNDSFDENKFGLVVSNNTYTGSIENCEFPKVDLNAKLPWTITTINFINLRSTQVNMKNALGISFIQPVIQGRNQSKFNIEGCNSITIMNGDIEDEGIYMNFMGNKNANIRSFGNNILALKGNYFQGELPDKSYFDDSGYLGIGKPNVDGKYGKIAIYNTDTDITQSNIASNSPVLMIEGNDSGTIKNKYTYSSSDNGDKSWGTVDTGFKNYHEQMRLTNKGNFLIGSKVDTGEKFQVTGSVKLDKQNIVKQVSSDKPEGYIQIVINGEKVHIPYYK